MEGLLVEGLAALQITLAPADQKKLLDFLLFLQKWNQIHNLTAITDLREMLIQHVFDSLSIAPFILGNRILDIGSGAGFPGIPLALVFPQKLWFLLDSKSKKTAFLRQATAHFELNQIDVINDRVETHQPKQRYDMVICRALGKISDVIKSSAHVLTVPGQWLFMKGAYPSDELASVQRPYKVHRLQVPYLNKERHLVVIDQ